MGKRKKRRVKKYLREKFNIRGIPEEIGYVIGNLIHIIIWIFLGCCIINAITGLNPIQNSEDFLTYIINFPSKVGINEIYTFIGSVSFVLFGIMGIYDFLYANKWWFFLPPAYVRLKERNQAELAKIMMESYYQKDIQFIKDYESDRTRIMLQAMGIEERQFHYINYDIIKACKKPERNFYALKAKAERMLLQKNYIVDQTGKKPEEVVYDKVDYFINFYTVLYDDDICQDVGNIMYRFLELSLKDSIASIDYIVVPQGSNFLLGLAVGKILNKPVIAILEKERIYKNIFWDGDYKEGKTNNIVVIHDVLVSGKRIYESLEKLPKGSYNLYGIFCLMRYNNINFDPIKDFREHGVEENQVNCLLDINETVLRRIIEGKYEYKYDW